MHDRIPAWAWLPATGWALLGLLLWALTHLGGEQWTDRLTTPILVLFGSPLLGAVVVMLLRGLSGQLPAIETAEEAIDDENPCKVHPGAVHDFVVTTPPGYGHVHSPCTGVRVPGFTTPHGEGDAAAGRMREQGR